MTDKDDLLAKVGEALDTAASMEPAPEKAREEDLSPEESKKLLSSFVTMMKDSLEKAEPSKDDDLVKRTMDFIKANREEIEQKVAELEPEHNDVMANDRDNDEPEHKDAPEPMGDMF